MKKWLHGARLLMRDLWLHFFWGLICILRRRHLDLAPVGDLVRKGYRGMPMFQCRRCFSFHLRESEVKRLGGKSA